MSVAQSSALNTNAMTPVKPMIPLNQRLQNWQAIVHRIRQFFITRNITEVITPTLINTECSEIGVDSIPTNNKWLRTSPENEMKSLLLQGSGDIYQIGPVFRQGDIGHLHRPEFTMLEWYRQEWSYIDLLNESIELLQILLADQLANKQVTIINYQELFERSIDVDPFSANTEILHTIAMDKGLDTNDVSRHTLLDFLFESVIASFNDEAYYAVINFPPEQASFANINDGIAERFEIFHKGIELVNGYQEITTKSEYLKRLAIHQNRKSSDSNEENYCDQHLLDLLDCHPLPKCAGVSMGIERILMCYCNADDIEQVQITG